MGGGASSQGTLIHFLILIYPYNKVENKLLRWKPYKLECFLFSGVQEGLSMTRPHPTRDPGPRAPLVPVSLHGRVQRITQTQGLGWL